jgi:hypothetical protein
MLLSVPLNVVTPMCVQSFELPTDMAELPCLGLSVCSETTIKPEERLNGSKSIQKKTNEAQMLEFSCDSFVNA